MKKTIALILGAVALLLGLSAPAQAAPQRVATVAPITCSPHEDSCVLAFVANNGNGYVMARQNGGSTWVRLTLVPGWDNSSIAPITCKYSNSCILDFVGIESSPAGAYWRAAQASTASVWVRLTLVNGQ